MKIDKRIIGHLLRLSIPMASQNAIIGAGGMVVQYVINGYGFIIVAGFTATNRLYGLLEMAPYPLVAIATLRDRI